jgi:putative ABC transport system permease protein
MHGFGASVRHSVRTLLTRPAVTTLTALTLGTGLAAMTITASLSDALLVRPHDLPALDRLMLVREHPPQAGSDERRFTPADFLDVRQESSGAFQDIAATRFGDLSLTGTGEPESVSGFSVTSNFFALLGAQPARGRAFAPEESAPGRDAVVILSDRLWKRRFAGDPSVVGTTIHVNGRASTVIGIMPPAFNYPLGSELWTALAFSDPMLRDRSTPVLNVVGRLRPGMSTGEATARLHAVSNMLAQRYPQISAGRTFSLLPLRREQYEYTLPFFVMLQAAALLVLVVACANAANLTLARLLARRRELAIRAAIGASRSDLILQFVLELGLVALFAGGIALAGSRWAVDLIRASVPLDMTKWIAGWDRIRLNGRVIGLSAAVTLLTGILLGAVAGLRASAGGGGEALRVSGGSASPAAHRLRHALVVAQVGVAFVILVAAGLFVQGFTQLGRIYEALHPQNVLTFGITLRDRQYPTDRDEVAVFDRISRDFAAMRGVEAVAAIQNLPASNVDTPRRLLVVEGRPALAERDLPGADVQSANAAFFRVFSVRLRKGRLLAAGDGPDSPRVAVISETMATRFWPAQDAIGRRVRLLPAPGPANEQWVTVVGIVDDIKQNWFDPEPHAIVYLPYPQAPARMMSLAVRSNGSAFGDLGPRVRRAIHAIDPELPVSDMQPMEGVIADALSPVRIIGLLMFTFGGVALALVVVGVFGLLAQTVAQRSREFGIRIALGADVTAVRALVIRQAALLASAGLALALPVVLVVNVTLTRTLLGVVSISGTVIGALACGLVLAVLAAGYLPARAATRVDPLIALRAE